MLWISTGKSRKDINWKNIETNWCNLVKLLRTVKLTSETVNEYSKYSKDKQGEIKDIGGYVGGVITGGRRTARSIQSRSLITLDVDFCDDGAAFFEDFALTWPGVSAVMHSTHSSRPGKLRYRLIIPLTREVLTDQYEAIARYVAGSLGIENFDKTTFQSERLMFWPSIPKNAKYEFFEQRGKALNGEEVLSYYKDWADRSQWPIHAGVNEDILRLVDKELKQENPLDKPGLIGAFCRTYGIAEVIEKYLSNIYEPTAQDDRYTFKEGSTVGGLVVYENMFAYSHHNTDPVSGKLVNAFDLVRLSLYNEADKKADPKTNTTKLPSYKKVLELATKDKRVTKLNNREQFEQIREDFKDEVFEDETPLTKEDKELIEDDELSEDKTAWLQDLTTDKSGNILASTDNLLRVMLNDPRFKNRIAYEVFTDKKLVLRPFAWDTDKRKRVFPRELTDDDTAQLRIKLGRKPYDFKGRQMIDDIITVVSQRNKFNAVLDYLNSTVWDGEPRLDTLLIDFLGAVDSEYIRAVTRKTFVAAVARAFDPGCKFDYVLTLISEEGKYKSSFLRKMGLEKYFSDTFNFNMVGNGSNKAYEQLRGKWIIEVPELTGLRKAELTAVKAFITGQADDYRKAYGKENNGYRRTNIFIGTTNEDDFLKGSTGNRRFWPVRIDEQPSCFDVVKHLTPEVVAQIYAEALMYYKAGEKLYLPNHLEEQARKMQQEHTETHPYEDIINDYLEMPIKENWYKMSVDDRQRYTQDYLSGDTVTKYGNTKRDRVNINEIWTEALAIPRKMDLNDKRLIKTVMQQIDGWQKRADNAPVRTRGYPLTKVNWHRKNVNALTKINLN